MWTISTSPRVRKHGKLANYGLVSDSKNPTFRYFVCFFKFSQFYSSKKHVSLPLFSSSNIYHRWVMEYDYDKLMDNDYHSNFRLPLDLYNRISRSILSWWKIVLKKKWNMFYWLLEIFILEPKWRLVQECDAISETCGPSRTVTIGRVSHPQCCL